MNIRPIAISLSPNSQTDDVGECFKAFLNFTTWQKGIWEEKVQNWFIKYYQVKNIYLFNSGRSALFAILKSYGIGFDDEVIVQAFTCVAVPDPVIWVGAKPVYVDIDESLNIDCGLLSRYITNKTKAIIVQNTFGIPAKLNEIKKITQKYNLVLIEDCSHSLGATLEGKRIGDFGDAAFFSFGRDKIISSVFGGAAFIRKSDADNKLKRIYEELSYPKLSWILKQLFHPLAFFIILPLYNFYLGKVILFLMQKINILSKPVENIELTGGIPAVYPQKLPNALARLAFNQLQKLESFNIRRKEIAQLYFEKLQGLKSIRLPPQNKEAIYLRFNILSSKRDEIFKIFRRHKILLGLWYSNIIDPVGVDYNKVGYKLGMAKNAEEKAHLSLNLPTYPTIAENQVMYLINLIIKYAD